MFRTVALLALAAGASAFRAPMRMAASKDGMSKSVPYLKKCDNLAGYVGGEAEFDPVGFSNFVPMDWLREAELKHARVCMLATLGFVATDLGLRIPGPEHALSSVAAHDALVSQGAMTQLGIFILPVECLSFVAIQQMLAGSGRAPGDYGFDPLNLSAKMTPDQLKTMQLKELKNGRLAMLAFSGIVTQAALSGHGFPYV